MALDVRFSEDPSSVSTSPGNLTENTYSMLRADILACRLRPGQQLKIHEICSRLHVSPGAVREALSRLSAEELVVSKPQKGFRVAPVRVDDLEDLTRTRIEIECMCLRRAIAIGGIEWETGLVAAGHRLSKIASPLDSDEWANAHARYHLALVEACDSAWLLRLRALLYAQSERYRRLSLSDARIDRDVDAEHRALVTAALARDAGHACSLLADHLALTAALVRSLEDTWHQPIDHRVPADDQRARAAL
jgi:DNA-binding GntR family transcriptional regulator